MVVLTGFVEVVDAFVVVVDVFEVVVVFFVVLVEVVFLVEVEVEARWVVDVTGT